MKKKSVAVVIISNGPGELTTWVKPVIDNLREILNSSESEIYVDLRLVLVPCSNATGREYHVAKNWNEFDLITSASNFWKLLIMWSIMVWRERRTHRVVLRKSDLIILGTQITFSQMPS